MNDKILIIDDEENIRKILSRILTDEGYQVSAVESGEKAIRALPAFQPAVILLDQNMPGMNGIEVLKRVKEKYPLMVVIIITAHGQVELAVDAIKSGAYDYVEKPFDNHKLLLLIKRGMEHFKMNSELSRLKNQLAIKTSFGNIIAISPKMKQVIEEAKSVCETNASVLIHGESGVGKEIIAKAIHNSGNRKNAPLIAVNCGAIPVSLLESEFFGYEKGAFTDAKDAKPGKFEQAHNGTLFLDEVGELPMDAQVKLLRVLEEKKVTRLGGNKSIPVDVRILCATNKNLDEKVKKGEFRLDLLYRLNIFSISIPPLRERQQDIPVLVETFIQRFNNEMNLNVKGITRQAMELLLNYLWPGNIRDLQNAIQSAMILAKCENITSDFLPARIKESRDQALQPVDENAGLDEQVKNQSAHTERILILEALEKCQYNRTKTAGLLKISRKTLFNKMKMYGI
jgi:DNA-binding NtrC family response regulator